jgi:release factor glutamine methyltransferase
MAANAIKALIEEGVRLLSAQSEQPKLEAEILLSHVTGKSRTHFRAFAESEVTAAEALLYRRLIEQRQSGQPIAYLTGTREFWSLNFEVTSDVLIPRPETELLVEIALEWIRILPKPRVLDLGTGSGAIPISIAKERPDAELTAVELSPNALALAKNNAIRLGAPRIRFLLGDWLQALPSAEPFDLIVSNPPYISDQDGHLESGDLRYEPRSALASGPEGLDAIRTIAREARAFIRPGGGLALEHGFQQAPAIHAILADQGYHSIETRTDLQRHPRVTMARYA